MSEDLQGLDDLFRSGLEGKSEAPPRSVWEGIEKRLDNPTDPSDSTVPKAPPKPGLGWLKGLGGVALVGIIAASLLVSRQKTLIGKAGDITSASRTEKESSLEKQKDENTAVPDPSAKDKGLMTEDRMKATEETSAYLQTEDRGPEVLRTADVTAKSEVEKQTGSGITTAAVAMRGTDAVVARAEPASPSGVNAPGSPSRNVSIDRISTDRNEKVFKTADVGNAEMHASPSGKPGSADKGMASQVPPKDPKSLTEEGSKVEASIQVGFEGRMMDNVMRDIQSPSGWVSGTGRNETMKKESGNPLNAEGPASSAKATDKGKTRGKTGPVANSASATVGDGVPNSLKPSPFLSRFSLTPVMGFNHTRTEVRENRSHTGRPGDDHRSYRETEQSGSTVSPGLLGEFRITPGLSVQTGLLGLTNRIRIDEKDIKAVRDRDGSVRYRLDCSAGSYFIDPKTGTAPNAGDSIRLESSEVRTRYIGVPLTLQMRGGKGRVKYFGTAGVDVNVLTGKQASTVLAGGTGLKVAPVRSEGLRSTFYSGVVGGGVDVGLNRRISVTVQPQYRFSLKKSNEGARENAYPKTFSVMTGLKIGF